MLCEKTSDSSLVVFISQQDFNNHLSFYRSWYHTWGRIRTAQLMLLAYLPLLFSRSTPACTPSWVKTAQTTVSIKIINIRYLLSYCALVCNYILLPLFSCR